MQLPPQTRASVREYANRSLLNPMHGCVSDDGFGCVERPAAVHRILLPSRTRKYETRIRYSVMKRQ